MRNELLVVSTLVMLMVSVAYADHDEKWYQDKYCAKWHGIKTGDSFEYPFGDGTRADCVTEEYAIEFEFASKWYESGFQAQYYAMKTGKKPMIALIVGKNPKDKENLSRLQKLISYFNLPIKIRVIKE